MRAWLLVAGFILIGCSKKQPVTEAARPHSVKESATELKDDLIAFSAAVGESRKSEHPLAAPAEVGPLDSVAQVEPVPARRVKAHRYPKDVAAKPFKGAVVDSFTQNRPFTQEEIARFVQERYRLARDYLDKQDPRFYGVVEEAQALSNDGTFALLKARWALLEGEPETAIVQAELALRAPFRLDPEGRKAAALLKCRALDSIKVIKPSERADAAAARAWLSYNLNYSP